MSWGWFAGSRSLRDPLSPFVWRWYVVAGVAATVLAARAPAGVRPVALAAVLLTAAGVTVLGLARHPVPAAPVWLLLLAVRGCGVAAAGFGLVGLPATTGDATAAGTLILLPYPLLAAGAALLAGRRQRTPFWTWFTRVVTVATGLTLLGWSFLLHPSAAAAGRLAQLQVGVMALYAVLDLVGLAVLGRVLLVRRRRSPAALLLALAALATVLGDLAAYRLGLPGDGPRAVDAAAGMWLTSSILLGAACLHPSIARGAAERAGRDDRPACTRPGIYAVAALAAAGVPLATPAILTGHVAGPGGWPEAVISAVLGGGFSALLVTRLGLSARDAHRRADDLTRQMAVLSGEARGLNRHATELDQALQRNQEHQRDLEHRATHDQLTGLANRALLTQRLDRALDHVGRHAGIALLLLDLDGFKAVNDTLGHLFGDELLRTVAQRLTGVVPAGQTVARLGGDEFAVLLTGVREADEAMTVAERMLAAVASPYLLGQQEASVTVSIGVRHLPRFRSESATDVMRHADIAMYDAKRGGKNRASLYSTRPVPLPRRGSHGFEPAKAPTHP